MSELPNIYSRRKRSRTKTGDDVYFYDMCPKFLLIQIHRILTDICGTWSTRKAVFAAVSKLLTKELGVKSLWPSSNGEEYFQFENWFTQSSAIKEREVDERLDALEFTILVLKRMGHQKLDRGVAEINERMLEAGFGYQCENGQIIQIGSTFTHKEIVVPVLGLLSEPKYHTANDEFRDAHDAYRNCDYENCLVACCKAVESLLKIIGDEKGWGLNSNVTMKALLDAAYANNLIPIYTQNNFNGLRSTLESVSTVRNKSGGHGAGTTPHNVSQELAEYQLNQTASMMLYLMKNAK